jgi:hypothetical protein
MPKKILTQKIISKLDKLQELLDQANEIRIINSDDPETWDSDALYNLVENLKDILKLLEDQTSKTQKDESGEPLILEPGLCSLVDEYYEEEEENYF